MKFTVFFMFLFLTISCAVTNPNRVVSGHASASVEEVKKDIVHNYNMGQSFFAAAKGSGFQDYVASLEGTEVDDLDEKVKALKKLSKEVNDHVNDWFNALPPEKKKEILKKYNK